MIRRTEFLYRLRVLGSAVCFCLMVAASQGAEPPSEPKTDRERLVGTWMCIALQDYDAKEMAQIGSTFYRFDGKGNLEDWGYNDTQPSVIYTNLVLNEETKPKQLDYELGSAGDTYIHRGIYELDGDTLIVVYNRPERVVPDKGGKGKAKVQKFGPRSTDIRPKAGEPYIRFVFVRLPAASQTGPPDPKSRLLVLP